MSIILFNRQRKVPVPLPWLRRVAGRALAACLKCPAKGGEGASKAVQGYPLSTLDEVEVTFVSDAVIARVHADFMGIPGPTDVITFAHGEILISAETARVQTREYGRPLDEELLRYVVHGLLHLNGHEDKEPAPHEEMHRVQEEIVAEILGGKI